MKPRLFPLWLALLATSVGTGFAQLPHFDNVTVTVIGDAGQNMETLNRYKDDFTQAGITIKQVGATFTGLYDKLKTSFVAGSNEYYMGIFYPSYIRAFARNGYPAPLDEYRNKTPASDWGPHMAAPEP